MIIPTSELHPRFIQDSISIEKFLCIIGYYAVGTKVDFVALTQQPARVVPLYSHDLRHREGRFFNLVHLIRLCGVISWMGDQPYERSIPEFKDIVRYVPSMIIFVPKSFLQSGWVDPNVYRGSCQEGVQAYRRRHSCPSSSQDLQNIGGKAGPKC